jgi:hypothetical protein
MPHLHSIENYLLIIWWKSNLISSYAFMQKAFKSDREYNLFFSDDIHRPKSIYKYFYGKFLSWKGFIKQNSCNMWLLNLPIPHNPVHRSFYFYPLFQPLELDLIYFICFPIFNHFPYLLLFQFFRFPFLYPFLHHFHYPLFLY